ncbi:hypothetical protein FQR65_LT11821 [Abscondita terminalis]|nr:hypothetical protein FQR65_LT11821 [Abscondita terminalis]
MLSAAVYIQILMISRVMQNYSYPLRMKNKVFATEYPALLLFMKNTINLGLYKYQKSVMKACNSRNDLWLLKVQSRLLLVNNLLAAFSVDFTKDDPIPKKYQHTRNSQDELRYKPLGRPVEKRKLGSKHVV